MQQEKKLLCAALLGCCLAPCATAQSQAPTILKVDVDNWVEYQADTARPDRLGTNPNVTKAGDYLNFFNATLLGDIVAVNDRPARGLVVHAANIIGTDTSQTPGSAIADITRTSARQQYLEIMTEDGTLVGTIVAMGLNGGTMLPPGTPSAIRRSGNFAIIGGTGAFQGARGQIGQGTTAVPVRAASMEEDPANRRLNGGGRIQFILSIIPETRPAVVLADGVPRIFHASDWNEVSAASPAAAGEILMMFATGLGPTRPSLEAGVSFPESPEYVVNSPVRVTVNGEPAEVLTARGLPGTAGQYLVQFRMPTGAAKADAAVQVTSAWIPSAPVTIPMK